MLFFIPQVSKSHVQLRGQRTEWVALAPQSGKQRQWQWRQQQRPCSGPTLLEESECDGGDEQEEGLNWGKVGRLMSKYVDQLKQRQRTLVSWDTFYQVNIPKCGGGPQPCSQLIHPTQVRSLARMISRAPKPEGSPVE